jgi:predicted nucleic acid-binding protein
MPSVKIECFLDTNILIYAASGKRNDPQKFRIAYGLILNRQFAVTGQTLAEFCNVARRKAGMADEDIEDWLHYLGDLPFVPVDQSYVLAGLENARRHQLKYYDAALLAAAERLGAPIFYTEDLNHNQVYGSVRAVNPFLER